MADDLTPEEQRETARFLRGLIAFVVLVVGLMIWLAIARTGVRR